MNRPSLTRTFAAPTLKASKTLEVLHEQDKWLMANRQGIDAKIRKGIEELERGEGIPEDELGAYLERLKAQPE